MKIIVGLFLFFCSLTSLSAQNDQDLKGVVIEKTDDGKFVPVAGANVYWLGTTVGNVTDSSGAFSIPLNSNSNQLVVRSVGYRADTLKIRGGEYLRIVLISEAKQVGEMEIVGERSSTIFEYKSAPMVQIMTERELFKAACCNLSESFETNPSIDVSFTDAITGMKQIEMLGLAGTYSQITIENMPAVRGLSSVVGLTFLPGIWMESIQVSKGVGSVANGYESITGQINVELRKPESEKEQTIFFNLFGNQDRRMEGNLNFRKNFSSALSSMTLLHGSTQRYAVDGNHDRFLDMPLARTLNVLQRFHLSYPNRLENQFGIQFVTDEKEGGTLGGYNLDRVARIENPKEYGFGMNTRQLRIFGKTGYIFAGSQYKSAAIQWSYNRYRQNAFFNLREYNANETMGYFNFLFQSSIDSTIHKYRLGLSFLLDEYDETFTDTRLRRIERVPGLFLEYTYSPADELTLIAGLRADHHNIFGTFVTPRLHLRYTPHEDWVLRLIGGRGVRTANALSENVAYFASARNVTIIPSRNGYPFNQEAAWNVGFNVTHYFLYDWREGTVILDLYRTVFDDQLVIDLDRDPRQVIIYDLEGKSYSNSIQIELNFQPIEKLETRIAYRFLDVKQNISGVLRERPFVARHRAFLNFAYSTERENPGDAQMLYDLTIQWFGRKRLPDTQPNPVDFRARQYSPGFLLANAQVTRSFHVGLDFYLGVENLLGFRQDQPIIDPANPDGPYFDSSFIWGPIAGRIVYAGLRWRM